MEGASQLHRVAYIALHAVFRQYTPANNQTMDHIFVIWFMEAPSVLWLLALGEG